MKQLPTRRSIEIPEHPFTGHSASTPISPAALAVIVAFFLVSFFVAWNIGGLKPDPTPLPPLIALEIGSRYDLLPFYTVKVPVDDTGRLVDSYKLTCTHPEYRGLLVLTIPKQYGDLKCTLRVDTSLPSKTIVFDKVLVTSSGPKPLSGRWNPGTLLPDTGPHPVDTWGVQVQ